MTQAFDEAKKKLEAQGMLSDAEVQAIVGQFGDMTEEEHIALSVEIYERVHSGRATVTLEQYLEATKVLDTAAPGSPEYKKAEAIATAFESSA
ncbi:MAG: hypothetical protein JXB47_06670 [Anaerolineae bacterium]|nr:hypothetical protein [Anaerolineae bacterium]